MGEFVAAAILGGAVTMAFFLVYLFDKERKEDAKIILEHMERVRKEQEADDEES